MISLIFKSETKSYGVTTQMTHQSFVQLWHKGSAIYFLEFYEKKEFWVELFKSCNGSLVGLY